MTTSIFTKLNCDLTDTVNNKVNTKILEQELDSATLSVSVAGVTASGTTIRIELEGNPTTTDVTTCNTVVAAHEGLDFSSKAQFVQAEEEFSDDSGDVIDRLVLGTGALANGKYMLNWSMGVASSTAETTSGIRGALRMSINGGALEIIGETNTTANGWLSMSGFLPLPVKDGDQVDIRLSFLRTGASGDPARVQFARIFLTNPEV